MPWCYRGDMKVAVSIPDHLVSSAERFAREHGMSRSQLYRDALAEYLRTRGITEALNAVRAVQTAIDPALGRAQLRSLSDEAW